MQISMLNADVAASLRARLTKPYAQRLKIITTAEYQIRPKKYMNEIQCSCQLTVSNYVAWFSSVVLLFTGHQLPRAVS